MSSPNAGETTGLIAIAILSSCYSSGEKGRVLSDSSSITGLLGLRLQMAELIFAAEAIAVGGAAILMVLKEVNIG